MQVNVNIAGVWATRHEDAWSMKKIVQVVVPRNRNPTTLVFP